LTAWSYPPLTSRSLLGLKHSCITAGGGGRSGPPGR
jgi:hypothetical protein